MRLRLITLLLLPVFIFQLLAQPLLAQQAATLFPAKTVASSAGATAGAKPQAVPRDQKPKAAQSVAKTLNRSAPQPLAISFEPNVGQANDEVQFLAHMPGATAFFDKGEVIFGLETSAVGGAQTDHNNRPASALTEKIKRPDPDFLLLRFVGANSNPALIQGSALQGKINYFIGNDPDSWHANVPTFSGVTYQSLYEGIDLEYTGAAGQFKSTYHVAPGANPQQIRWHYEGAESVAVDAAGNLQVRVAGDKKGANLTAAEPITLTEQAPLSWQEIGGKRVSVATRYVVYKDGSIGFNLGQYEHKSLLLLDPALTYSTYLGGNLGDQATDIAIDDQGDIYVTGDTLAGYFPLKSGWPPHGQSNVAFLTKIDPASAELVYSTYIGGDNETFSNGIAVDSTGNAYLIGFQYDSRTNNSGFPIVGGYRTQCCIGLLWDQYSQDGWLAKFSADGSTLQYSTFIDNPGGVSWPNAIAVDNSGGAYLGCRRLTSVEDAGFAVKVNTLSSGAASHVYTHDIIGSAAVTGIAVNISGEAYVVGRVRGASQSQIAPTANALQHASAGGLEDFIGEIEADGGGRELYLSYFGGTGNDNINDIALDSSGDIYITGYTTSATNFPLAPTQPLQASNPDGNAAFVTKFTAPGSSIVYSTFLGGNDLDSGAGIAVDSAKNVYVAGLTESTDFPIVRPLSNSPSFPLGNPNNDTTAAFITKLNSTGTSFSYSTYLNGGKEDAAYGIAVDAGGNAFVAGITYSSDFPVRGAAFQSSLQGSADAFVVRIADTLTRTLAQSFGRPEDILGHEIASGYGLAGSNMATGNMVWQETDLLVDSPGLPLDWWRTYNSRDTRPIRGTRSRALGRGWSLSYDAQLEIGAAGLVTATLENGAQSIYTPAGSGYQRPEAEFTQLYHDGSGYKLVRPDQTMLKFSSSGRLTSVADSAGRTTSLSYSGDALSSITDSSGRSYAITTDGQGRILTITDNGTSPARVVTYQYTGDVLTKVTDTRGQVTQYDYSSTFLSKITLPGNNVSLENQYDSLGRVTWQQVFGANPLAVTYDQHAGFAAGIAVTTTQILNSDDPPRATVFAHDSAGRMAYVIDGLLDGGLDEEAITNYQFTVDDQLYLVNDPLKRVSTASYDSHGNMLEWRDATGNGWDYGYDSLNRLTSAQDALGHATSYDYTTGGLLAQITDGLDQDSFYSYSNITLQAKLTTGPTIPLLTSSKDELGRITTYGYNSLGQRVTMTNALNQVTTQQFDGAGRLIKTTDPGGVAECREYDAADHLTAVVSNCVSGGSNAAQNVRSEYGYDVVGRQIWQRNPAGEVTRTFYNSKGQINKVVVGCAVGGSASTGNCDGFNGATNPALNRSTSYGYDFIGRVIAVTDTLGIATHTSYDLLDRPTQTILNYIYPGPLSAGANLITSQSYDLAGQLKWSSDELGRLTTYEYDAAGRVINETRNNNEFGGADNNLVTHSDYNAAGLPVATTLNYVDGVWSAAQPDTDVKTAVQYDALNRVTNKIATYEDGNPATGNALADRTTHFDYDATGNLVATTDPLGRVSVTVYDALNRPLSQFGNCTDGAGHARTSNCAAGSGALHDENIAITTAYTARGLVDSQSDPLGRVTRMVYDGLGRPLQEIANYRSSGGVAPTNVTTSYAYDVLGNITTAIDALGATVRAEYNSAGWLTRRADQTGIATRFSYDGLGRQVSQFDLLGHETRANYDGLGRVTSAIANYQDGVVQTADGADRDLITSYSYDDAGRRNRITDPLGRVTSYDYDNLDRPITVIQNENGANPPNVTTRYTYDRQDRLTSVKDALNHTRSLSYNAAGWLAEEDDPLNRATTYSYDVAGRRTNVSDPRPTTVTYGYDKMDRLRSISASGLTTINLGYDEAGRRTTLADETGATNYSYDGLDRLTAAAQSVDGTVNYGYDLLGRRTSVSTSSGAPAITYNYDAAGRLKEVRRNGALHARAAYDILGRLSDIKWGDSGFTAYRYDAVDRLIAISNRSGPIVAAGFDYTLDRGGQITKASERISGSARSVSYTYDGLQRLKTATEQPGTSYSYSYDLAGNRTQVQQNGVTVETRSYDSADQVLGWSYDGAGNLLGDSNTTYSYDPLKRLNSVVRSGSITTYKYNGDSVLARQSTNGVTTNFTLDAAGGLSERLGATASGSSIWYVRGWGRELSRETSGTSTWYMADRIGSVRATANQGGSITASFSYDPYGNPESSSPTDFGFTGEPQSSAYGLLQLRARWYSTNGGRFLSHDPMSGRPDQPTSLSYYAYVYNDPIGLTDPSGMCGEGHDWWDNCIDVQAGLDVLDGLSSEWWLNNGWFVPMNNDTPLAPRPDESTAKQAGRLAGDIWSTVQGAGEMFIGGGTVVGGAAICFTIIGCIAGAPAAVAGGAMAIHGAGTTGMGVARVLQNAGTLYASVQQGGQSQSGGNTSGGSGRRKQPIDFKRQFGAEVEKAKQQQAKVGDTRGMKRGTTGITRAASDGYGVFENVNNSSGGVNERDNLLAELKADGINFNLPGDDEESYHAEQNLVAHIYYTLKARGQALQTIVMGVSRPICETCRVTFLGGFADTKNVTIIGVDPVNVYIKEPGRPAQQFPRSFWDGLQP